MIVNDQRTRKDLYDIVIGDMIIDKLNVMYLVIGSNSQEYGLLNLDTLEIEFSEDDIDDLIVDFSEIKKKDGPFQVIPQNKISLNIS